MHEIITLKTVGYILSGLLATLLIPENAFIALVTIMSIDMIVGMINAYIHKVSITSKRFGSGLLKKVTMIASILAIGLLFWGNRIEGYMIMQWLVGTLCFYEVMSILEKFYFMTTGERLPKNDILSRMIKKIYETLDKIFNK